MAVYLFLCYNKYMEYMEHSEYKERQYEYGEMLDRISSTLTEGREYLVDFADVHLRDMEKIANRMRDFDDHENRASEHLRQAMQAMQEKIEEFTTETVMEFNAFLQDHPGHLYVVGERLPAPTVLERFAALGEGPAVRVAIMHADEAVDITNGGYQLLINSSTIDV